MCKPRFTAILVVAATGFGGISAAIADEDYKVATIISAGEPGPFMVVRIDPDRLVELK